MCAQCVLKFWTTPLWGWSHLLFKWSCSNFKHHTHLIQQYTGPRLASTCILSLCLCHTSISAIKLYSGTLLLNQANWDMTGTQGQIPGLFRPFRDSWQLYMLISCRFLSIKTKNIHSYIRSVLSMSVGQPILYATRLKKQVRMIGPRSKQIRIARCIPTLVFSSNRVSMKMCVGMHICQLYSYACLFTFCPTIPTCFFNSF